MTNTTFVIIFGIVVACFVISQRRLKAAARAFEQSNERPIYTQEGHYVSSLPPVSSHLGGGDDDGGDD